VFTEILEGMVAFEGCDGSGTSTQIALLRGRLALEPGAPGLFATAEPTSGPIGRLIRGALRGEPELHPAALAGLFAADRCQHLLAPGGARERCLRGELVACDRCVLSSLAYQGLECGDALPRRLNEGLPAPGLILFFDLDPEIAQERLRSRPSLDIFERLEFQRRVRRRYLSLLGEFGEAGVGVRVIDASRPPEKVALDVWSSVSQMPIMRGGGGPSRGLGRGPGAAPGEAAG